jgi:hypothetical protein
LVVMTGEVAVVAAVLARAPLKAIDVMHITAVPIIILLLFVFIFPFPLFSYFVLVCTMSSFAKTIP